jgi:hypothetical protein
VAVALKGPATLPKSIRKTYNRMFKREGGEVAAQWYEAWIEEQKSQPPPRAAEAGR